MKGTHHSATFATLWLASCIAALLGFTFRLYWFAYFWTDDFNNLYWVQRTSGPEMLAHIINPASHFFRPVGMAFYWSLLRCCDLDPVAYHSTAWLLHTINAGLVYSILQRLVRCGFAAASGTALFACQAIFSDIYWSFGTIFEITCTSLFLLALYLHIVWRPTIIRDLTLVVLFVFAVKAKEMAITLPLVLALNDILQPAGLTSNRHTRLALRQMRLLGVMLLPAVWFLVRRTAEMGGTDPGHPYYMDFSLFTLAQGYGWYLNILLGLQHHHWAVYAVPAILLIFLVAQQRQRQTAFFLFYTAVTFLPVIFLPNHRQDFFWYLPFLGVSGLFAMIVRQFVDAVTKRFTEKRALILGIFIFPLLCREVYFFEKQRSTQYRWYFDTVAKEHRNFVQGLRALPPPPADETLFFESAPMHFDSVVLVSATQVALRRTDVHAERVAKFPEPAIYRLKFEAGTLYPTVKNREVSTRSGRIFNGRQ